MYAAWKDSDMRDWLVNRGYLRSDAQIKRDELIKLMQDKYATSSSKVAPYLNWPDARLRAYLIEIGIVAPPPTTRELLLQKVRENWNDTNAWCSEKASGGAALLEKIRAIVSGGVEATEDKLNKVAEMIEDFYRYSLGAGTWMFVLLAIVLSVSAAPLVLAAAGWNQADTFGLGSLSFTSPQTSKGQGQQQQQQQQSQQKGYVAKGAGFFIVVVRLPCLIWETESDEKKEKKYEGEL
jgi:hypothetical protein